jgi:hypothetical protein
MKKKYVIGQLVIVFGFTVGLRAIPDLNATTIDFDFLNRVEQTLKSGAGQEGAFSKKECSELKDNRVLFPEPLGTKDLSRLVAICDGQLNDGSFSKESKYPFIYSERVNGEAELMEFVQSCVNHNLFERAIEAVDGFNNLSSAHAMSMKGLIYARKAGVVRTSSQKVADIKEAIQSLNESVKLAPDDIFVRKIRFHVMSNIPVFFQDKTSMEADRNYLKGASL